MIIILLIYIIGALIAYFVLPRFVHFDSRMDRAIASCFWPALLWFYCCIRLLRVLVSRTDDLL